MDNNTQDSKERNRLIQEAAFELSQVFTTLEFENAYLLIKNFIQADNDEAGYQKIKFDGERVESIKWSNVPQNATIADLAQIAFELYGITSGLIFVSVLGGLFLARSLYQLRNITLQPIDSLMIIALLESRRKGGFTDNEWLETLKSQTFSGIQVHETFGLVELIERAKVLEKLGEIELIDGLWRFSQRPILKEGNLSIK